MANEMNAAPQGEAAPQMADQATSQDTPVMSCRCPRAGDLWQCAGRPELVFHPDGSTCALGEVLALSGRDHDPRGELARALKEADRRG